jgi:ribosomal protein L37E
MTITIDKYGNFRTDTGHICLVKCSKCLNENYTPNVYSGICSTCGFDINKEQNNDTKLICKNLLSQK